MGKKERDQRPSAKTQARESAPALDNQRFTDTGEMPAAGCGTAAKRASRWREQATPRRWGIRDGARLGANVDASLTRKAAAE